MDPRRRIRMTLIAVLGIVAAMGGLTAAAVPLYRLFCQVTGYGGTTQVAAELPERAAATEITVYFDAMVDSKLPWRFRPSQDRIRVRVGEPTLVFFEAENISERPTVGTAIFNVTPFKVGVYFSKVQCFCFDQQKLDPGERVRMGVSFFVDPEMLEDPNTREVRQITLSYTFYLDEEATAELARRADRAVTGAS